MKKFKATIFCPAGCDHPLEMRNNRLYVEGNVLHGGTLRVWPDSRIETNNPKRVCKLLGFTYPDPQVKEAA